jgi:hypothetical protein
MKEKQMIARTLILAAAVALGGCSTLADFGPVSKSGPLARKAVKNDQGHVIGFKQMLRNSETGEVVAQVNLFTPIVGESGSIVGYEEPSRGGAIIRDLAGHSIGGRFADLRSRSTNSNSKGFTLIVRARGFDQASESEQLAAAKPKPAAPGFMELLASLTSSDLNRIR